MELRNIKWVDGKVKRVRVGLVRGLVRQKLEQVELDVAMEKLDKQLGVPKLDEFCQVERVAQPSPVVEAVMRDRKSVV